MRILIRFFCFIFLFGSVLLSFGQKQFKLKQADVLEGGIFNGQRINKFKGNVVFHQKNVFLYCDSAYQYQKEKSNIEAFGHIRIVQGDTVTITGDRLKYDGETKTAIMTGNVYLKDPTMTLTTNYLEYHLKTKEAHYTGGGTINDGKATLTSEVGFYNTGTKIFRFKKDVKIINPSKNFTLTSDTLNYNSNTKEATFNGPTHIESPDGIIDTESGTYNTATGLMNFSGRTKGATVVSGSYKLTGDYIKYDEKKKMGTVKENVVVYSEKDKIMIFGDVGQYWGDKGISKVYGHAVMKTLMENDTLYLKADTLISIDPPNPKDKRLLAFSNAKIFKSDLQGKCDSLVYNFPDSTIYFYRDPVLWSGKSQITADSINVHLVNNKIHTLNMALNSFIVSQDTIMNFNQVKGRNMTGYFKNNSLSRINVDGNGESIYFALEKDSIVSGMNKIACSNMVIRFDSSKLKNISFIKKPDGRFIPPHEIKEPDTKLKGFVWRKEERPQLSEILELKK